MSEELKCPVCGSFYFEERADYDMCPVCGWFNDEYQKEYPDKDIGCNHRSLNEHRKQWQEGTLPDYIYELIEQNKDRLPPE